jgi:hypothetical protein
MKPSLLSRLATGASAALLAVTGLALGGAPAQARTYHGPYVQPMFSYDDGWRVDQHVRELADVDGDGRVDVVGFGRSGVYVGYAQLDGSFTDPVLKLRNFGTAQGWNNTRHVRTVADVDGDGREDLVGFGNAGVYVSYAQPDGSFTPATVKLRQFGWDQGWRVDQHPREVVDLVGNGTADIVGFGYSGVTIAHGQTDRTFIGAGKRIDSYGYNRGWRADQHPRMLADVDGDGAADIVGLGDAGAWVSYFSVAGDTFTAPRLLVRNFGSQQGWRVGDHPRELGDVNGDGRADIVGFGHRGVSVAYSQGYASFSPVALKTAEFGQVQGWRGDRHLRTLADVDGNGVQDLVGFGNAGVLTAQGRADDTFEAPFLKVPYYGYDDGWSEARYPRLLGDTNGDGREDIVGFGHSATYVALLS